MGEKGAVVSKQQLSDEFLDGFRACEETPKVEETAFCSETDVDAVWQVVVCLTEHDAEEDGEQCEGQNASLLDVVGDEEAALQRPIVLHLTLLTFMQLVGDGEKFGGQLRCARIFHSPSQLTVSKALVRSTKAAYRPMFCSLHFSCICLSTKIVSVVPLLDLNLHWLSCVFLCYRQDQPIQQDASQDFACNGEQSDASVVLTVLFFALVFVQRDTDCIPEVLP